MSKKPNITGRDGPVIAKALAYAIEAIGRLPDRWQEKSDREDMLKLLNAVSGDIGDMFRFAARYRLDRGMNDEDHLVLGSGAVIPLNKDFAD
jgi:hypothetical protein